MNKRVLSIMRKYFLVLAIFPVMAVAVSSEYIRDYSYKADDFDTKYTSRIRAIDGVKKSLVEELGTYVQSVVNISKNNKGEKSVSHDIVTLTAGILSTKILDESWNRVVYYVKASIIADKDEVLRAIEALKNDYKLEESLRDSLHELEEARQTINKLEGKMKLQNDAKTLQQLNNLYIDATRDLEVEYKYQRALKAIIERSFNEALSILKDLSDKDFSGAQSKLGYMYERGLGVEVDYGEAARWYLTSINNGNATAYARLGYIYERGLGVRQDFDKAAELYKQSAIVGNPHGQSRLGRLYLIGKGVEKDTAKALQLFKDSVTVHAHGRGYAMLGYMYEKGIEVDQDYKQAAAFYDKAMLRGNPFGMARMAWMYAKGYGVKKDYDKAWSLSERAEEYNNPFGLAVKGYLYEHGMGAYKDDDMAMELYQKSASQNSRFAMFRIGNMYEKGKSVTSNVDEALKWYRRAADLGHEEAIKRFSKLNYKDQ